MRFVVYDRLGSKICQDVIPFHCNGRFLRVLFIFSQDDILFDVQNLAAAQGESSRVEDSTGEKLEQFKNICADGNIERPIKTIPIAISKCEKKLHKWAGFPIGDHLSIDNAPQDRPEFVMELKVEEHFTTDIAWALMRQIQEYIEMFVLYDWAGITYPEGKQHWLDMLNEAETEIKDLVTYMDDDCDAHISPNW